METKIFKGVKNQIEEPLKSEPITYYEAWLRNYRDTQMLGSFTQTLLKLYQIADAGNRAILEKAYPHYFITLSKYIP